MPHEPRSAGFTGVGDAGLRVVQKGAFLKEGEYWTVGSAAKPFRLKDASGEDKLGVMYGNGLGVDKDYSESLKWFRKSAEQGDAKGEAVLGAMYAMGHGVDKDYSEAL